jgi:hypothetical protein
MTEKPILFSGPMVRAILDGRKTMTRRVIKVQPPVEATSAGNYSSSREGVTNRWTWMSGNPKDCDTWEPLDDFRLPYAPGDLLWVRETWAEACELDEDDKPATDMRTYYRADGEPFSRYLDPDTDTWRDGLKWKPSILMPRWASRITLRVTAVKVERLQDISEEDAKAEGVETPILPHWPSAPFKSAFRGIWLDLHGPGSWEANPWVMAVSFERVKP